MTIAVLHVAADADKALAIAAALAAPHFDAAPCAPGQLPESADCVIVCWSQDAVRDSAFQEAAATLAVARRVDVGLVRGIAAAGPHWIDLSLWQGGVTSASLIPLRERARLIASAPKRRRNLWALALSSLLGLSLVLGLVNDTPEPVRLVCNVPGINGLCALWGIGGVATPEQERQFLQAKAGGCDTLRDFAARFPQNPRADDAGRLVALSRKVSSGTWVPEVRNAELFIVGSAQPSKETANAATNAEARERSREICGDLPQPRWRRLSEEPVLDAPECRAASDGWRCDVRGKARCQGERYVERAVELCS